MTKADVHWLPLAEPDPAEKPKELVIGHLQRNPDTRTIDRARAAVAARRLARQEEPTDGEIPAA